MISTHRYLSFKKVKIAREKRFQATVGAILFIAIIATEPSITLFLIALCYAASGPAMELYGLMQRKNQPPPSNTAA
jgi:CDP-diacylglycerol--serine O-phosphatidyltransferase